ncbi:MAG: arsenate reductase [Actinomycetia bacterium]|nr:arsenate reductase [Actinomycetes bacterium]
MADVTIWHNPNCSTSKFAVARAEEAGVDFDVRKYMLKSQRPERSEIVELLDALEDPATDLVRRDAKFKSYELGDADVQTPEQVADVLGEHPELLQRPVLVKGGKAIIGRPKDRVDPFLAG